MDFGFVVAETKSKDWRRLMNSSCWIQVVLRSLVSWAALISGYYANGMHRDALKSMICTQQEGFRFDVVMLETLVPGCYKFELAKI